MKSYQRNNAAVQSEINYNVIHTFTQDAFTADVRALMGGNNVDSLMNDYGSDIEEMFLAGNSIEAVARFIDWAERERYDDEFQQMLWDQEQEWAHSGATSNDELKYYVFGAEYHDTYTDSHKVATTAGKLDSDLQDYDWSCQGYAYYYEITAEQYYDEKFELRTETD